ncbi:MAG TPA: hypothetical protein DCM68_07100 [Verrucomicrobia bacterium]|nr:hypothetical protein [Verrucomicrobiota bacterium]
MSQKQSRWLLGELPTLLNEGVIDGGAADRLRQHYESAAGKSRNWALTVFGILGGTLVGLGIILLLAHNWADLSRAARTVLAFSPLAASLILTGWILRSGKDSAAWREGGGAFWMLSIGAAIALVAQTYHIPGDAGRFALTWMLLSLPVIYLLNATGPALAYLAGMTFWAVDAQEGGGHALLFWPLAALILPHIVTAARENAYASRPVVLFWGIALALCVAIGVTLEKVLPGLWIIVYGSLFAGLYLAGEFWFGDAPSFWQKPFQVVGSIGGMVLAFMLTYEWPWEEIGWHYYRHGAAYHGFAASLDYALAAALPVTAIALLVSAVRRGKPHALFLGALPILAVLGYALVAQTNQETGALALFNLYVFIVGIGQLVRGFRSRNIGTVNAGLLIVFALILLRFFDEDLGFVFRGVVFVLLGAAFLVVNLVLARRKGATS